MSGTVFFVGAGTGSADLLTLRAARLLASADVVLHDDLVAQETIDLAGSRALVVNVGKRCGARGISQATINVLLVDCARRHECVVRLKSGDPAIFGRLGEEMDALRAAAIRYEIVPGVTAAVSAAAAAQITLTDRRFASSVTFATASRSGGRAREWKRLFAENATVVIYMPGSHYARLASELLAAGVASHLPCSLISRAGSRDERAVTTTVAGLAKVQAPSPAVVIVGEVVRPAAAAPTLSEGTFRAAEPRSLQHQAAERVLVSWTQPG